MTYTVRNLNVSDETNIFEQEVQNSALLDSGCPQPVAGESWVQTYMSTKKEEF